MMIWKKTAKGRFNALRQLADELPPAAYEQRCHELLTQQMGRCAQPFEMLPILKDKPRRGKLLVQHDLFRRVEQIRAGT